jgi:hypothetical protein
MANARGYFALLVVAFAMLALLTPASYADSNARIVRLSDVEGNVQIDRNTGHGLEKAVQNMPITQGVRLETGSDGRAEVEFENGSVLRLADNTAVEFSNLSLRSSGDQVNEVKLNNGTAYVNYRRKGESEFRISVGNRPIDLEKDARLRIRVDRSSAEIAVFKGELKVQGPTETAKVKKNETLTFNFAGDTPYEVAKGINRDPSDNYNQERDQYLDQYASSKSYGNSPYTYGYRDMNAYGSFFNAPGYGTVWRPAGFGPGWDPFADGYWSFYPGYGYVWVSGYQWGWTPYRYGAWTYIPAYGWCWQPGQWNRWNSGINVVNPPAGWRNPAPPPRGGGTTVVVGQPRGPRSPRMLEVDDSTNPKLGQPRTRPVTALPGRENEVGSSQQSVPGRGTNPGSPGASQSSSQAGKLEPRPAKIPPDSDLRGEPAARKGAERPSQQTQPNSAAPSRQMSPPPAPPAPAARPAPAPRVERSAPSPAPRMQSSSPPIHSGGGHTNKTSPK